MMKKPTIEILPAAEATFLSPEQKALGLPWAYRITSAVNAQNAVIGVIGGKKADIEKRVKDLAKKIKDESRGVAKNLGITRNRPTFNVSRETSGAAEND